MFSGQCLTEILDFCIKPESIVPFCCEPAQLIGTITLLVLHSWLLTNIGIYFD